MPLRPEEIEDREFAAVGDGLDAHEVRAFLRRVAAEVADWEERLQSCQSAQRSEFEAILSAEEEGLSSPDKFGAVGDRIAALLRQAYDTASETELRSEERSLRLRSEAEAELERARGEAARLTAEADTLRTQAESLHREASERDAEAERLRAEAEQEVADAQRHRESAQELLAAAEADAVIIRDRAEEEGNARLDDREAEIGRLESEIAAEREQAFAEVADARSQVAGMLEEARGQSEFIKLEAEEIIRTKVRTNVDAAQKRIDVLRNTEIASRNRILTAHRELESALERLDTEPVPEFGPDVEREVLTEAEQRSIDADYPPFFDRDREAAEDVSTDGGAVIDATMVGGGDIVEEAVEEEAVEVEAVEVEAVEVEAVEVEAVEVEAVEAEAVEVEAVEVDVAEVETTQGLDEGELSDEDIEAEIGEAAEVVAVEELAESKSGQPSSDVVDEPTPNLKDPNLFGVPASEDTAPEGPGLEGLAAETEVLSESQSGLSDATPSNPQDLDSALPTDQADLSGKDARSEVYPTPGSFAASIDEAITDTVVPAPPAPEMSSWGNTSPAGETLEGAALFESAGTDDETSIFGSASIPGQSPASPVDIPEADVELPELEDVDGPPSLLEDFTSGSWKRPPAEATPAPPVPTPPFGAGTVGDSNDGKRRTVPPWEREPTSDGSAGRPPSPPPPGQVPAATDSGGYEIPAPPAPPATVKDRDRSDSADDTAGSDGPADSPRQEDGLARLVREAMQRAVDNARGDRR